MNYKNQLLTKNWKQKRLIILKRDNFKCKKCNSTNNLHVHHLVYEKNLKAWEAKNENLITLCNICHAKEHDKKPISSFFNKKHKIKVDKKKSKILHEIRKSRKEQVLYTLNQNKQEF
jgi:5-methylcytosine-specific restriction endonuclease McrA